jgi:signal transduction histidine kinase/CheY-like chemotaxis protein
MRKRIRLIYKLLSGFGLVVALVLGLFLLANKTIESTSSLLNETITKKIRPLAKINHLHSQAANIRRLEAELPGIEDYWALTGTVDKLKKKAMALEQGLLDFVSSDFKPEDEAASRLVGEWQLYRRELEGTLKAALEMNLVEASRISSYRSLPRFQIFAGLLEKISSETEKSADEEYRHALSDLQARKIFFFWISLLGIGLVALFAWIFSESLSSRILELSAAAEQLFKGAFDYPVRIKGKDEIADLALSFNRMRIQIKSNQEQLEELVEQRTAELAVSKEEAEAANAAKSVFLAHMSHEIRTPLNAVIGLTHIVLKSELTAEQRDYLNKVRIASNNLLAVINDILDFSKVEAGRLELARAPFNLDQVLEQLADLFSSRVAQKDLELIFTVAPAVPRQLAGDAYRLVQVLTNLVENAVKFTDRGEIVVGVESTEHRTSKTTLKFWVRDTGSGIAADVLPSLFEPFTQAGSYLTRRYEGTGLGLTICRHLVGLMGGTITAESTPGQGSTFAFSAAFEVRRQETPRFKLPVDLRGLKALVVDDSATARKVVGNLLESFNFYVSAVDSGEKAIEALSQAAKSEPYQLVLLDWKMPGLDGIETAMRIHNDPNLCRPPIVILITTYGRELVQERIESSAVDSFLLKPIKPSDLFNTIMELFNQKEAMVERIKTKRALSHARLAGRRVLVAEDSQLNRVVAVGLLQVAGLVAETAENGRMAVDKVTGSEMGYYDAVLMDIQMPVMDGYEATRQIREWECQRPANANPEQKGKIPIIALTAHVLKGEKEKCLAADMDDYLPKPIDEQVLHRVLLKWIAPH